MFLRRWIGFYFKVITCTCYHLSPLRRERSKIRGVSVDINASQLLFFFFFSYNRSFFNGTRTRLWHNYASSYLITGPGEEFSFFFFFNFFIYIPGGKSIKEERSGLRYGYVSRHRTRPFWSNNKKMPSREITEFPLAYPISIDRTSDALPCSTWLLRSFLLARGRSLMCLPIESNLPCFVNSTMIHGVSLNGQKS